MEGLTVSPMSGSGPGTVTVTAANSNGAPQRTATAVIAGQDFVVTQAGPDPVTIQPATASLQHDQSMQFNAIVGGTTKNCQVDWTLISVCGMYAASTIILPGPGSVTVRGVTAFGYYAEGQVASIILNGRTLSYGYDGDGLRVLKRTVGGARCGTLLAGSWGRSTAAGEETARRSTR
jgi:YD repeat-containing protein